MQKYNIGLDIGTTSVGWAVVESETQKIIRKGKGHNRKALWGVRLFDSADTAERRRNFRSSRRRYDRRRNRIQLLQKEFESEMSQVDADFFLKLKQSKYNETDRINKTILLSTDEKQKIIDYNANYKTIYHLRNRLINDDIKVDIRLVYLAIHHIIKYRGNFNYAGDSFDADNLNIEEKLMKAFEALYEYVPNLNISENYIDDIDIKKLSNILLGNIKNDVKADLKKELVDTDFNKNFATEFGKMIVGNQFTIKKLFLLDDSESKVSISFDGTDLDDKFSELEDEFGEDIVSALIVLKELYDAVFLKKIFKGSSNTSISSLMVEKYNQHKEDLRLLKDLFIVDKKIYHKFFKTKKEMCFYERYLRNITAPNKTSYELFRNEILKYLPSILDSVDPSSELVLKYNTSIKDRIANDEFLPKITDTENGKYPYQLNKSELIKIIENQGKYYPFLLEKVNGTYKLVKLLEFKIPYYVGPLVSENKSQFAWMERKVEKGSINPYNFDEVVDKESTAEKFIKRMISRCTYLLNEYALPNNSILYSKYKVMNELKQIKVNGEKLTIEQQNKIMNELFMKNSGSITDSKFKKYLYNDSDFFMYGTNITVTGYSADGKFANTMQSYYDFFGEDGIFVGTPYNETDAEQIIEWITIFEDKDILEKKIINTYLKLNDDQIKRILKKKYSGWGNLSKKLLTTTYYVDEKTNIKKSVLDLMNETNENFMQIINNDKYQFQNMIKENNTLNAPPKLNYNIVKDLVTSPANKKGIYQALKVVAEIIEYMGYEPEHIAIEMARSENKKKQRKDDRVKYLLKLYETAKEVTLDYNTLIKDLKKFEEEEKKLDEEKMYLYYLQEGKCLYCGNNIVIEQLSGSNYEVDHILPRTLIKDNSWDNKALVCRCHNQEKGANLVLPQQFRNNERTKKLWERLKKNGLISSKKLYRLTRKQYSDEDVQNFINRQIVETRQITKHVANIISNFYKNSKVIYLKASYPHDYRIKYGLYKFRQVNDYHHAHDAYLVAVLGEYREKYMKHNINFEFVKQMNEKLKDLDKRKDLRYGYAINCLDEDVSDIVYELAKNMVDDETGEILFNAAEFNKKIEDTLYRNDILISRKTEIRTGEFYNQTIQKKGETGVPLKKNMPTSMYGSYTGLNPSYAVVVEYTKKNNICKRLVGMPIKFIDASPVEKESYLKSILSLDESETCKVISDKIPFYSYLDWNGQICYLVGATYKVEVINALQFHYKKSFYKKHKETLNKLFNNGKIEMDESQYSKELTEIIKYIVDSITKDYLLFNNLIDELKKIVKYNENFDFSIEEKEKIIIQLTNLLNCKSDNANFKFLDTSYSSAFGKKNGRTIENGLIINKSVTGIWENKNEF